ncbi:MAG: redoxin domain-containing protein [Solirubrobacterales bacterium]
MKTWGKVIVALVAIGAVVSLIQLRSGSRPVGSENLIGQPLPDFAAPLAQSGLRFDSNVFTPDQARLNKSTAACNVKLSGSFNSCDGLPGRSVVVFWNADRQKCIDEVDQVDKVLSELDGVSAVAVAFNQPIEEVAPVVRERGWKVPVVIDRDGAVSALYSVAGCPTVFFADDGEITNVRLSLQNAADLRRELSADDG